MKHVRAISLRRPAPAQFESIIQFIGVWNSLIGVLNTLVGLSNSVLGLYDHILATFDLDPKEPG